MTVFKKELRAGMVSFLIWSAAVGGLMAMCVWMYPSFAGSMDDVSALFAGMEGFSSAFGMDKLAFGSIMGFYGVECGNIMGLGGRFSPLSPAWASWPGRREATRRSSS